MNEGEIRELLRSDVNISSEDIDRIVCISELILDLLEQIDQNEKGDPV